MSRREASRLARGRRRLKRNRAETEETIRLRGQAKQTITAGEGPWWAVFENCGVGIALADLNGVFVNTNRAFQEIVGYTNEELRQGSCLDIIQEDDRPAKEALIGELLGRKRQQFQIEKRCRRKE